MVVARAAASAGLAAVCATGVASAADVEATPVVSPPAEMAPTATVPTATAPTARPNVVVLYLDDLSAGTSWLWSDPRRTPELARFSREGVEFSHAIASTPLCGPARGTLLTGRYGHGHGVTGNGADNLDPGTTIATELRGSGYYTIYAGKYLNGLEEVAPTRRSVRPYAAGWRRFDIIWQRDRKGMGQFYDYRLWTKSGVMEKDANPWDHSTLVIGKRVAKHIRSAPRNRPVFAIASLGAGHYPNTATKWDQGAKSCADVRPYRAPSFNERSVADKPRYIRELPRLDKVSFDLVARCEEMLSVDAAVRRIRAALSEGGRLDDTLFFFTSDNGFLLNDHRMPGTGGKKWPHALPVPLYALWPDHLGDAPRVVDEPVSNVDLPVTICALAGCSLPDADGLDITSLLTGETEDVERRFLYTEMLRDWRGMPPWYGLITTRRFDADAIWHYTEYASGGHELYDLRTDPYRLHNLARDPDQAKRLRKLHRILHREVIRPQGVRLR